MYWYLPSFPDRTVAFRDPPAPRHLGNGIGLGLIRAQHPLTTDLRTQVMKFVLFFFNTVRLNIIPEINSRRLASAAISLVMQA